MTSASYPSDNIVSIEEGSLRLDVRRAVAVRRFANRRQSFFYLSLFDDEIDSRLEDFLPFWPTTIWNELNLASAALHLEPTDAIVIAGSGDETLIARGGACNFPLYWAVGAGSVIVSTILPVHRHCHLSVAGLLASVAVVSMTYQNEPNLSLNTPLSGWFRCRRAALSKLSPGSGCVSERPLDHAASGDDKHDRDHLTQALRLALDKFGRRQKGCLRAVVELSGGLDSTMTAIAARSHGIELQGISVHFPFYEFRFEEGIQQAASEALTMSRVRLDGTAFYPYAPPDYWPRLDEPATSVIGLKRDLTVARLAMKQGVHRIFVGQGGDQLFAEDMLQPLPMPIQLARGAFSKAAWITIEQARNVMISTPAFRRRSTLTYLYDARLDVALKEALGTITRSPFTDLDMIQGGLAWASLSRRLGAHEGKQILVDAFAEQLPNAVVSRRGKVCWDGVCARAYALHGHSIVNEIERVRGPLERAGLDVPWLTQRVGKLARWETSTFGRDDREVFAVYALATWLHSWGIEQVSDAVWE